ncbi:MAG: hypothetical protein CM15mP21_1970 [Hyphomicrobiales bacterium]|nr:MAG: hypothetical protein CM15mP21_1970 [Hyphomicrobiales bacterium]
MRRIARFTLGPFARKISDEDFATYQQLLNELIIKVYANRLGEYGNEQLVVGAARAKKNFISTAKSSLTMGASPSPSTGGSTAKKTAAFRCLTCA